MMETIIEKCDQFVDMQVWPIEPAIRPQLWLSNFHDSEREYAINLLNSFYFFNEKMCRQLLITAFRSISYKFRNDSGKPLRQEWQEFCKTCIFTYPDHKPTGSGNNVLTQARKSLGFDESKFYSPNDALAAIYDDKSQNLVFVDDFIGSGTQFTETWTDLYPRRRQHMSYTTAFSRENRRAFYIPLVATEYGITEIFKTCNDIEILPAHILPENYNAAIENSKIWPENLKSDALNFLKNASKRAGYEEGWAGFKELGLTIAFYNSIPDATLPLFYSDRNGWKPLMERS